MPPEPNETEASTPRLMPTQPGSFLDRLRAFLLVCVELALILLLVRQFEIEEQKHCFPMLCLAATGFAVRVWLPQRHRIGFFVLLSLGGVLFVLDWPNGSKVIGSGLLLVP